MAESMYMDGLLKDAFSGPKATMPYLVWSSFKTNNVSSKSVRQILDIEMNKTFINNILDTETMWYIVI